MTADWYLFWKQHYEHEEIAEYDLLLFIMGDGFRRMGNAIATHFIPAFNKMAVSMNQFFAAYKKVQL